MRYYYLIFLSLFSYALMAQDSTGFDLNEVSVTANRLETPLTKIGRNLTIITARDLEALPVKTIDAALQFAMNVDVRSRSPYGVQSDVSIRGGHFNQTLFLVNGIKVNDPQTGHHNLNLPVTVNEIEKIEVLTGGASRIFGPAAFAGAINIITKKEFANELSFGASAGQHGLLQGNAGATYQNEKFNATAGHTYSKSNGYIENTDFKRNNTYFSGNVFLKTGEVSVLASSLNNDFGASNFYHPLFFLQREEINSKLLTVQLNNRYKNTLVSNLSGSYKRHNDAFDFNNYAETNPDYINYHKTDVWALNYNVSFLNKLGKTAVGAEFRSEKIVSNRLGDDLASPIIKDDITYTKQKSRENINGYVEHQKTIGKAHLSGGFLFHNNNQFGSAIYPGIDLTLQVSPKQQLYSSISKSLRYPTFTEMYLNTSTVKGNVDLLPEKAWNYEIGHKINLDKTVLSHSVFYRKTTDAIDKVWFIGAEKPEMVNINDINMFGYEFMAKKRFEHAFFKSLSFNYSYLLSDKTEDGFQSFYSLNYLKHNAGLVSQNRLSNKIDVTLTYNFKKRTGTYDSDDIKNPYKEVHYLGTKISYNIKKSTFFVEGTNLLNQKYFDFGFVELPGIWLNAGFNCKINYR